jgi:NADH dehydrogenase (ubiquinone) 1 alpha subcomplex subunit 6
MSFAVRAVKVPPPSASLEEARHRVFEFFKSACRSLPQVMEIYTLHDVVTVSELRSAISAQFRKNTHITNPKVSLSLLINPTLSKHCVDRVELGFFLYRISVSEIL